MLEGVDEECYNKYLCLIKLFGLLIILVDFYLVDVFDEVFLEVGKVVCVLIDIFYCLLFEVELGDVV